MTKFAYNNAKNINTNYTSFELYYQYYFYIFLKKILIFAQNEKL